MIPVTIDCETTGVDPAVDKIVEIAAVWDDPRKGRYEVAELCNPGMEIPPPAMAIHHITDEMVYFSNEPQVVLDDILCQIETDDLVFVAHNAEFDKGMLGAIYPKLKEKPWICTWRCAMHLWPDAPSHSNQSLRYWLKLSPVLPEGLYPHRALYDTIVTRAILDKMLETHTLEQLIELSTQPVLQKTIRFGKHRGMLWSDVPRDYLQWLSRQDMDMDVLHTAKHWLRK